MKKPVCVVVGVGPGNGAALARRFHAEGYAVALLARSAELIASLAGELAGARAYPCDVTDQASVERTFSSIAAEMGPVEVLVYNAGSGVWGTIEDLTANDFELIEDGARQQILTFAFEEIAANATPVANTTTLGAAAGATVRPPAAANARSIWSSDTS